MAYYFFLGVVPLPVTPASLNIKTPSKNEVVTLINDGEINIPKTQGLQEISFSFLLPRQEYPFANLSIASSYTATAFIPLLKTWKTTKLPFPFIVTRTKPNGTILDWTSLMVLMEDFEFEEDADSLGLDVQCHITLREYKDYGTKRIKAGSVISSSGLSSTATNLAMGAVATAVVATVTTERSTATKTSAKSVIVKEGDTLWSICKKELGDGSKYKEVAKLNKLENPDKIYVGQKLRLS